MSINYLKIIKDAWKVTWKNRYLWWFGFFVIISGGGSGMNYFFGGEEKKINPVKEQQLMDFFSNNLSWIVVAIAIAFLLLVIFLILGIVGRGALISSIEKNSKGQASDFKSGWLDGKKNFWKILAINFFLGFLVLLILLILITPIAILFLNKNYIIGGILVFLAILIFIPIAILSAYLKIYGYIYAILGKLNFWPAIENAYGLFVKNIWTSILMSLIFIPISIVLMFIVFAVFLLLFFIFLIFGGLAYLIAGKIAAIAVGSVGFIIFLFLMLFVRSIYEVFAQAVWIFFFREIATPKAEEVLAEIKEEEKETVAKPMPVVESKKEN
jgi:hypothetical protein